MTSSDVTPAHDQKTTHHYLMHYPDHPPRESDPHYRDFEAYRRRTQKTAQCEFGVLRGGDFSECDPGPAHWPRGLEMHHSHIEFALQNGVDLALLEKDYPGISDPDQIGAWVESPANLMWLCTFHHRGPGGVHVASESDYTAAHYIRNLIS